MRVLHGKHVALNGCPRVKYLDYSKRGCFSNWTGLDWTYIVPRSTSKKYSDFVLVWAFKSYKQAFESDRFKIWVARARFLY